MTLAAAISLGGLVIAFSLWAAGHAVAYKRDSRGALLWTALICLAPVIGPLLYFGFGLNRVQRRAAALRRRRGCDVDSLPWSATGAPVTASTSDALQALAGAGDRLIERPLVGGSRLTPLLNGDAGYPAMLHAISTAQRSVTLCSYIFDGDETGLAFAGALAGAVRRGVAVRVLIDASSELFSSRPIVHALRRAHVPCRKFLPAFSTWPPVSLHLRNHRKLLVVDGRVGFTGGMNIMTGHWLRRRPARPVLDLHFKVEGPVVAQLQEAFADDWRFTTGEILAGESWFPPPASAGHSLVRGIASGPGQRIHPLRWLLLTAIGAAQRSIWILTPYFVPNAAIIAALSVARLRGVSVEILLPCRGDVPFVQWASAAHWWQLLEPGCRIWVAPPPFDHTKLCVVDDEWSLVGSPNWDPRSLALNYEFALECYDPAVAAELSSLFLERRERAREVTLAEMDARSLPLRLRDGLARLAAPLL